MLYCLTCELLDLYTIRLHSAIAVHIKVKVCVVDICVASVEIRPCCEVSPTALLEHRTD